MCIRSPLGLVRLSKSWTTLVLAGIDQECQLTIPIPGRMYAVAIPVSLLLLFNIIALIRTAFAIKQQVVKTQGAQKFSSNLCQAICVEQTKIKIKIKN